MSHRLRLASFTLMLLLGLMTTARADTVTFSTLVFGQMTYTEAGMTVSSPGGLFPSNTGVGGSRNLAVLLMNSVTFTFSGGSFNALNIEVNLFPDNGAGFPPNTAVFMGFNGATQTGTLTLVRNVGDPPPPLLLNFGAGFQGITRLVLVAPVIGGHIQVDNLNFQGAQAVPEPATIVLLGVGLFGMAIRRKRSQV